jgi:hypothetical protein
MKTKLGCALIIALLAVPGCKQAGQKKLPPEVTTFAARKEAQAKELANRFRVEVSPNVWRYFNAAKHGDLAEVMALFEKLKKRAGQYEGSKADPGVTSEVWQTVLETHLACEQVGLGEPKYTTAFGQGIISSIPAGSIYFGGTDPGRGLVTLFCKSQETGDPFFTVTQNALADGLYLSYLRRIYGGRLYTPTTEDAQSAFNEYLLDAQVRMQNGKLKEGEDVKVVDNRVQVSGQVAVMAINALLAKVIFEKNPERECFVEESFPLDWMYPHLAPHGLIMVVHRQPVASIPAEEVEKDQQFWRERSREMVGDWLKPETPVNDVCEFAAKIFGRQELSEFRGDPKYVQNTNACAMFSKLRSAIAGVYAWRAAQAPEAAEKKRMIAAADFGFRQAYALCPYSPEAVFRYVSLLEGESRHKDALQVAQTSLRLTPKDERLKDLVSRLQKGGPAPIAR